MRTSVKLGILCAAAWLVVAALIFVLGPKIGVAATALLAVVVGLGISAWIYFDLKPLDEITDTLEATTKGKFDRPNIPEDSSGDVRRLAQSANQLKNQFEDSIRRARELAAGKVGAAAAEERVLKSGALSDGDVTQNTDGALEGSIVEVTNHLRRLALQARVVGRDELHNPLLDERVPGELGDAFALMVRNLRALNDRAREIADGNLTSRVDGDGELSSSFNRIVERYQSLSEEIVQTALHISSSAEEILSVLREQEFAASHQASGVEETQRTMETLLSSAKRIAESAQTVFKSAEKTQANNRTVAERIGELKAHTERIGEILEVIKSIADRSDLLALNASLEGMRAGEAGKGFTLVAAEMRRLAENIKESVGDIKALLSDIRESALSSVMATEEGSNLSERTTESALKITLITQQQQSGTEQVTQSMDELSSLINHGVSGMRQVTTAAGELVKMSEDLRIIVEQFRHANSASQSQERPRLSTSSEYPAARVRPRITESQTNEVVQPKSKPDQSIRTTRPTGGRPDEADAVAAQKPNGSAGLAEASSSEGTAEPARETVSLFAVTQEDPPTVELTGLSEEEEREMLAEALRTRTSGQASDSGGNPRANTDDSEE